MNARVVIARTIQSTILLALRPAARRLCLAVAQAQLVMRGRASQPVSVPVNQWDDAEEWS
jgi:hypothetical protein